MKLTNSIKKLSLAIVIFIFLFFFINGSFFGFSSNLNSWQKEIIRKIAVELSKSDSKISKKEALEKFEKLKKLKKQYPDPKVLFSHLKSIYEQEIFLNTTEKNHTYGVQFDPKYRKSEKDRKYIYFDKADRAGIIADNTIDYQINVILKMKDYYPLKGEFQGVLFIKKLSGNPNLNPIIEQLKIGPDNYSSYYSSDMRNTGNTYGNVRPAVGIAFKPKMLKQGVYALQIWFYPDALMARTLDGIIKSKTYVLNVKGKKK